MSQFTTPDYTQNPAKPSGGSGSKSCLVIGGCLAAAVLLICVGGGIFGFFYLKSRLTTDPEKVLEKTLTMVEIDPGPKLEPKVYFDFWVFESSVFTSADAKDSLLLVSMASKSFSDETKVRTQIESQMRQSGDDKMPSIETTKAGERTFNVRGKDIEFKFNEARDVESKEPYYSVSGIIDSKQEGKKVMILLQVRQSEFSEDQIQQMIEAIR